MSPSVLDLTGKHPKRGSRFVLSEEGANALNKEYHDLVSFNEGDEVIYPEYTNIDNRPNQLWMSYRDGAAGLQVTLKEDLFKEVTAPGTERK
jgi:hypothetical protein